MTRKIVLLIAVIIDKFMATNQLSRQSQFIQTSFFLKAKKLFKIE